MQFMAENEIEGCDFVDFKMCTYHVCVQLKVYADQECITVKYIDEDNDDIIISSQDELFEAFKVNTTFRVFAIPAPTLGGG